MLPVLEPPKPESLQVKDDTCPDFHIPKLTVRQRHGKLFDELDLSGLNSWAPELADAACWLLAEYHEVFSLYPAELGCTHCTEHTIKVTDDTLVKERFRQIPPQMAEEVRNHLREMLESSAIRPSQSTWGNGMVLVRKKDGGLHFCIDFPMPECPYEEGFPPLAQNTGGIGQSSRHRSLFLPGTEIWILADKDG